MKDFMNENNNEWPSELSPASPQFIGNIHQIITEGLFLKFYFTHLSIFSLRYTLFLINIQYSRVINKSK